MLNRLFALALLFTLAAFTPATAQISIQLGGSDADMKAMLAAQGYDRIDVVDRGLSSTTFQACRGADRFQFKVYWDGRISTPNRIGGCRVFVTAADVNRTLLAQGYERINLEEQQQGWVAIACAGGSRVRIDVSQFGDLSPPRTLGPCQRELGPTDVAAVLERQGYDRIEFTQRQPPRYVLQACLQSDRFELVVDTLGNVVQRRPVGACDAPVNPYDLPTYLADRGFDRAKVIDARPPRYRVEACRGRDKVELVVSRYGRVLDEVRIGRCSPPVSIGELTAIMAKQGYSNISIADNGEDGYVAVACLDERRNELIMSRFGEVLKERDLGRCASLTVEEVLRSVAKDGWRGSTVYVEGCRQGRRLRLQLNEYGEEVSRERIGRC
jgi:hypothetical protein